MGPETAVDTWKERGILSEICFLVNCPTGLDASQPKRDNSSLLDTARSFPCSCGSRLSLSRNVCCAARLVPRIAEES